MPMNVKWELPDHRFYEAVDFMLRGHPWPKQLFGPVSLDFRYDFGWIQPRATERLPAFLGKNGPSEMCSMRIQLQRNSFIQPDLVFPYGLEDSRLYDFLAVVAPKLPFALRTGNFRRKVPLKNKTGFKLQRIPSNESTRLSEFAR
jgi:hypothetical protein